MNSCKKNCSCSLCKSSDIPPPQILRGIDVCHVNQGIPSSSCCPKYFFANGPTTIGVPVPPNSTIEVINVSVTTNSPNERVRLDSMFLTAVTTESTGTDYSFRIGYRLFRDTTQLTGTNFSNIFLVKQSGENALIEDTTNITWTDVPATPGTYNYRVTVERSFPEENILNVFVFSRSLDAIVFPPVNFS